MLRKAVDKMHCQWAFVSGVHGLRATPQNVLKFIQDTSLIPSFPFGRGKAGWSHASWKFVEPRDACIVKTPPLLDDNPSWCVEMFRDVGDRETLTCQHYDPGPNNVTIW